MAARPAAGRTVSRAAIPFHSWWRFFGGGGWQSGSCGGRPLCGGAMRCAVCVVSACMHRVSATGARATCMHCGGAVGLIACDAACDSLAQASASARRRQPPRPSMLMSQRAAATIGRASSEAAGCRAQNARCCAGPPPEQVTASCSARQRRQGPPPATFSAIFFHRKSDRTKFAMWPSSAAAANRS